MSTPLSMAHIPNPSQQSPIEQIAPSLSISSDPPECPVCFEELSSPQIVYTQCCFQKICENCDQIYNSCIGCRADLGDVRIQFGSNPIFQKCSSKLRLLPGKNTVDSIILTIKNFFPLVETQLTSRLTMVKLIDTGGWASIYEGDSEITNIGRYFLNYMRLPHHPLSDREVESWIVTLLTSGNSLPKNKLTIEEIHKKCTTYAMRIYPFEISQEYISSRLKELEKQGFCKLDENKKVYRLNLQQN